ncbi:MAG: ATP-binding protein [Phycisphaerales bacterium]|nr:ATP-binding protein [Phycisphaerales bacterium]
MPQSDEGDASESSVLKLVQGSDDAHRFQEQLTEAAARLGYDDNACFAIRLAVQEATINAFQHGNKNRPGSVVSASYEVTPERITITITDQGDGFDPTGVPDPTDGERLELPTGRGILIMRAFMTDVAFNKAGNSVVLTYEKPKQDRCA